MTSQNKQVEWVICCGIWSRLFSWCCLLFKKDSNVWNKHGFSDVSKAYLTTTWQRHERSQLHSQYLSKSTSVWKTKNLHINWQPTKPWTNQHNEQVESSREILKQIVDVICYLEEWELSLWCHNVFSNLQNRGNYSMCSFDTMILF